MTSVELYINNSLLQLSENIKITLTKQINDFRELKDRQTDFTNSIDIPFSSLNDKELETNIHTHLSRKPYKKVSVKLRMNGVEIIHNGFGILRKTNFKTNKYTLNIYNGIIGFFDSLGNKKINELVSLESLNHNLDETTFINSFQNTWVDGYTYAIADFGNIDLTKIKINYQLPVIFVKWLWNEIFNEIGFTPSFFPDDDMVISMLRGWQSVIETLESWQLTYRFQTELIPVCSDPGGTTGECSIKEVNQNNFSNGFYFSEIPNNLDNSNPHVENGHISITHNQKYDNRFYFSLNTLGYRLFSILVTKTDSNGNQSVVDEIFRTNSGITETATSGNYNYNYAIDVTKTWQLENGDKLKFELKFEKINRNGAGFECYSEDESGNITNYYSCPDGYSIQSVTDNLFQTNNDYVSQVDFRTLIGEIKYKDFIKDILNHYALMVNVDDEKNVFFVKAKDMLNKSNSVDWSDKFVEIIDENYNLSNYGQNNIIDYNYNKFAISEFAKGKFNIDNEILPDEKVVFKKIWNASEKSDKILNGYQLQFLPFWVPKRDDTGAVTSWTPIKDKNYLCRIEVNNSSFDYGTQNGTTNTYAGNYYVLNFKNLNGQYIIDTYYREIQQMLNWFRILNIKIKMNSIDFDNIDFFKLIYFKQLGAYFYLNKMKYDGGPTTTGEFIYVNL